MDLGVRRTACSDVEVPRQQIDQGARFRPLHIGERLFHVVALQAERYHVLIDLQFIPEEGGLELVGLNVTAHALDGLYGF